MKSIFRSRWYILSWLLFLISSPVFSQTITGQVYEKTNDQNIPLIGAAVYLPGTTNGTTTDEKGQFTLNIPPDSALAAPAIVVSYLGYIPDTVALANKSTVTVYLKKTQTLQEVTVIGQTERFSARKLGILSVVSKV